LQEEFLQQAKPYLEKGVIQGIRLSTRPDMIDRERVSFLRKNGVTCIELGVQSMSDKVLAASRRGHAALDTERASSVILEEGLLLGHQMMLGLPLSTFEDEVYTAKRIKELGAKQTRIYPTVVIDGTELARLWKGKKYKPLSEEEAVERSASLISYFESNGIKVIRCGLHPSEGLVSGEEYLAGPFHPAFGQKARILAKKKLSLV
jgi:histone acetyltransferase (RNA polymerase elongator complex component)